MYKDFIIAKIKLSNINIAVINGFLFVVSYTTPFKIWALFLFLGRYFYSARMY